MAAKDHMLQNLVTAHPLQSMPVCVCVCVCVCVYMQRGGEGGRLLLHSLEVCVKRVSRRGELRDEPRGLVTQHDVQQTTIQTHLTNTTTQHQVCICGSARHAGLCCVCVCVCVCV